MSQGTQLPHAGHRIIIHHVSDLHYQRVSGSNQDDPLIQYSGYLDGLAADRQPNLIVLTGDLTATGAVNDLAQVATFLRVSFPMWAKEMSQHVFVVPGPRDINWEGAEPPGLAPFYEAFHDFGLPSALHGVPEHGVTPQVPLNCIAYPIDTCYSLEDFLTMRSAQFEAYGREFDDFVRRYREAQRSRPTGFLRAKPDRKKELAELRAHYLALTEANELTLLDAGRIHPEDLTRFTGWNASFGKGQTDPLKILITHHPLAVQPELQPPAKGTQPLDTPFEQLAKIARTAGFHLALHGHIHKPQVLSDLSLLQGSDALHPMRQVGAGSLGDGGTLNEITATYSRESTPPHWRLEIRTITLQAQNRLESSSFVLLNRTEDAAKRADELADEKQRDAEFDRRLRIVMHQFSDGVYTTQSWAASQPAVPLPQSPLQGMENIIREVVFPGFGLRVRLFLKDMRQTPVVPKLTTAYLEPADSEGTGPVTYPDSLAGLSLLLGKTLSYPEAIGSPLDESDRSWLTRTGKNKELVNMLGELDSRSRARGCGAL